MIREIFDRDNPDVSYVLFGKTAGFSATLGLSNFNGTNGFRLEVTDLVKKLL